LRKSLGGYELLERLGEGAAGVVFKARAPSGDEVALKLLHGGQALGERERRRFETEARTLARLDHPQIVRVRGMGQEGPRSFLIMDLVPGESLEACLQREGRFAPSEAVRLIRLLALGLQHAHERGVIHRDLKPDNVLVDPGGQPRLTDFGLAKDLVSSLSGVTRTGAYLGTPGYWAPEQVQGERDAVDQRADVYGLGATLYALLTGRPPIEAGDLAEFLIATAKREPTPPSRWAPEVDSMLDAICLRCLAKRPERRYGSAQELAEALDAWARGETGTASAPRLTVLAAALLVVTGGVGAAAIALGRASAGAEAAASRPPLPLESVVAASPVAEPPAVDPAGEALARAQVAADRGAWREARELLDGVLADRPDDLGALCLAALVRERLGEEVGARNAALRALALDPSGDRIVALPGGEQTLHQLLGYRVSLRLEQEDLAGARDDLDRQILLRPKGADAWRQRAEIHIRTENPGAARDDLTRYLQLRPDDTLGLQLRGIAYALLESWEQSLADFDRALRLEEHPSPPLYAGRGEARRNLGDLEGAMRDLERALASAPADMPGRALWEKALRELLVALSPQAEATFEEALAHERAGRLKEAMEGYAETVRSNPSHVEARYRLAQIANNLQQFEEAVAMFTDALRFDPGHLRSRTGRSIALLSLGRELEAREDAEAVLAGVARPEDRAVAFLIRGRVRDSQGDHDGAVEDFGACLSEAPDFPRAHLWRGLIRAGRGEHAQAIADLTEGLRRDPTLRRAQALVARGKAYQALGRAPEARSDYQAALQTMPPDAQARAEVESLLAGLE
jgi:tetratricopeptide (TPR) repeat protein